MNEIEGARRGYYQVGKDGKVENRADPDKDYAQRLETLGWEEVLVEVADQKTKIFFVRNIHPDEEKAGFLWKKFLAQVFPFNRVEVSEAHPLAAMLGRRTYQEPVSEERFNELIARDARNITIMSGSEEAKRLQTELKAITRQYAHRKFRGIDDKFEKLKDKLRPFLHQLGFEVDLNRQFTIPEHPHTFREVLDAVEHPQAKEMLQLLHDGEAEWVVSIHEDVDRGDLDPVLNQKRKQKDGFYFYYIFGAGPEYNAEKELVKLLHGHLIKKLRENGFAIYNGPDDPDDPDLGFIAKDGLILQRARNEKRTQPFDNTFESAAVDLGQQSKNKKDEEKFCRVKGAFCFEIPHRLSDDRKTEMLRIIQAEFIVPFFEAQGMTATENELELLATSLLV